MKSICITLMFFTLGFANLFGQTIGSGEAGLSDQNPVNMKMI